MNMISWPQYLNDINKLIECFNKLKLDFKQIYAIPRGGLIPATIISHYFNDIPVVTDIDKFRFDSYELILVVDDLVYTGKTFKSVLPSTVDLRENVFTAALYIKDIAKYTPDFSIERDMPRDEWIVFPYEKVPEDENGEIKKHETRCDGDWYVDVSR